MRLAAILSLLLSSCVVDSYVAVNGQKTLTHNRKQFGGTASFTRGDGSSEANDYQNTARDFFSAVGTVAGAVSYGVVTKAQNANNAATAQNAARQVTAQQKIASDEAVKLAEIAAAAEAPAAAAPVVKAAAKALKR